MWTVVDPIHIHQKPDKEVLIFQPHRSMNT